MRRQVTALTRPGVLGCACRNAAGLLSRDRLTDNTTNDNHVHNHHTIHLYYAKYNDNDNDDDSDSHHNNNNDNNNNDDDNNNRPGSANLPRFPTGS